MDNIFTVTPMSQRVSLEPGEVYAGSVTIVNPTDATSDFIYSATVAPYGVVGNDYNADFISTGDRVQMANWITISEPAGKIKPGESKEIKFQIKVPDSAPAGGQYAAIMLSSNNEVGANDGALIQNVFEMASLIYANVAGETVREGEILENNVPGFVVTTPIVTSAFLNNTGNVHEDATFVLTASDFFTGRVILPSEENEGRYSEIIMPETERYTTRVISDLPAVGVVKVSQTINYNGQTSVVEKNVIICPIWLIILVLLILAALVTVVIRLVLRHYHKKHLV